MIAEVSHWFFALPWQLQAWWIGLAVVLFACFVGVAICAWEDLYMPKRDETLGRDQYRNESSAKLQLVQSLNKIQKNATKGRVQ